MTQPARLAAPGRAVRRPMRRTSAEQRISPLAGLLVAGSVVFVVARLHESIIALSAFRPSTISLVLAALITFANSSRTFFGEMWQQTPIRLVVVSWVFSLLSVPGSAWPGGSVSFIQGAMLPAAVFGVIMAGLIGDEGVRSRCIDALLLGSIVGAVVGIMGGGEWEVGRFGIGYTLDPNTTAALFVMAIPYALARLSREQPLRLVSYLVAITALLYGILLTGSRGGIIGVGVMLLSYALLTRAWRRPIVIMSAALATTVFVVLISKDTGSRFSDVTGGEDYNLTTSDGRVEVWKRGLQYAVENPILGVGVGAFPYKEGAAKLASGLANNKSTMVEAHSIVIEALAELGIIGGGAALLAIVLAIVNGAKKAARLYGKVENTMTA